jgi:hypothetical protein
MIQDWDARTSRAYSQFLLTHGPRLNSLYFRLSAGSTSHAEIGCHILLDNVQSVFLTAESAWPNSPDWYTKLPPSTIYLVIRNVTEAAAEDVVTHLTDVLLKNEQVPFYYIQLSPFSWVKAFDDHAKHAGVWIQCARQLTAKLGVTLIDRYMLSWTLDRVLEGDC